VRTGVSDRAAGRTAIAQDTQGRLLIIVSEGAVTLADLALWLRDSPLGIVRAINLDGGFESQLAIRTPQLNATLKAQHGVRFSGTLTRPLPAVLALYPTATASGP
jgi:exopolysaccharide biosynthesis protein